MAERKRRAHRETQSQSREEATESTNLSAMITLTQRTHQNSAPNLSVATQVSKGQSLQPYAKAPVGQFTSTSPSTPKSILSKNASIDAQKTLIAQVGLENFIRAVVKPLNLKLSNNVKFNMNGQGRLQTWEDVFLAERVYTKCLGISKRIYQTHSYTHEPEKRLAYFILEEYNERSVGFFPGFDFFVLVFTYYDENNNVTAVDVQYDQMSFFLHCMGLAQVHAWVVERVVTPVAINWAKIYLASGLVSPVTFIMQLILVPLAIYWYVWG
jgi:hypothetical protein